MKKSFLKAQYPCNGAALAARARVLLSKWCIFSDAKPTAVATLQPRIPLWCFLWCWCYMPMPSKVILQLFANSHLRFQCFMKLILFEFKYALNNVFTQNTFFIFKTLRIYYFIYMLFLSSFQFQHSGHSGYSSKSRSNTK